MENTAISRAEHEEFCRRLDEENHRQNRRIDLLEQNIERLAALTTSVEKLATNVESMLREQERQGRRLATLEGRDGERWRKAAGYVLTAILGLMLGFIFRQLGL